MNIEDHAAQLNEACKRFNIKRLHLVGSLAAGTADDDSDVDFLVSFNDLTEDGISDRYFGFLEFLESELNSEVDLIEESAVKNPFFKKSLDKNKKLLYG